MMLAMPVLDVTVVPVPRTNGYQQYREQQILSATPMQLLLMVYDEAIVRCEARQKQRAARAITELIGALNFDVGEIAGDLFRLYEYCLLEIRRDRYPEATTILRRLKQAWEDALKGQRA
ncbi:MAG TPA: flagellar export chaperone FliS [Candidatus Baltobacteraceae bacterium]|nr:flagellar export chaperone FliS [Candidatus Baltobacteraceae bacterium]